MPISFLRTSNNRHPSSSLQRPSFSNTHAPCPLQKYAMILNGLKIKVLAAKTSDICGLFIDYA
jgi:hypothetical protein